MKPNAFIRLYPGDWLKDTLMLDATATGAYFLLILAHRGRQGLPNDDQTLRTISRVRESDWGRVKGQIAQFFEDRGGMWVNNRSVEDWEKDCADYKAACERTANATKSKAKDVTTVVTNTVTKDVTHPQSESESVSIYKGAVEPHPSFPKTAKDAAEHAAFVGCPTDFAETVWNQAMARGGSDSRGSQIVSFRHHLKSQWTYHQSTQAEKNAKHGNTRSNAPTPNRNQGTFNDKPVDFSKAKGVVRPKAAV